MSTPLWTAPKKQSRVNTIVVFGFVSYVSNESKLWCYRMPHIPLQTV